MSFTASRQRFWISSAFVLLALLGLPAPLCAELKWESQEMSVTLRPDQETFEARYTFKNTGTTPVRIVEVTSGCHCVSGVTDHQTYAPGEKGVFTATFNARGAVGTQQRILSVATDEAGRAPYDISLNVTVAEWATFAPRLVHWSINEAPTPKLVDVTLSADGNARLGKPVPSSPEIKARLIPATATTPLRIEISPTTTATSFRGAVTVPVKRDGAPDFDRIIYVRIY